MELLSIKETEMKGNNKNWEKKKTINKIPSKQKLAKMFYTSYRATKE